MIVQDQDFCPVSGLLTETICRRQTTNAAAHNDEVVAFARLRRFAKRVCIFSIAHAVSHIEASVMIPAHARFGGRVIIGSLFRNRLVQYSGGEELFSI